ncbi:MAG: transcription antitermination factor NusB [Chlamydiota bacterium]
MAISPQKFREVVFQILFGLDHQQVSADGLIELLMEQLSLPRQLVKSAYERAQTVREHLEELDSKVAAVSTSYQFDRIHRVEKNILRLGVYELLHDQGIPSKVAIAEAMRLSKKFSTKESVSFVNAILDKIAPHEPS